MSQSKPWAEVGRRPVRCQGKLQRNSNKVWSHRNREEVRRLQQAFQSSQWQTETQRSWVSFQKAYLFHQGEVVLRAVAAGEPGCFLRCRGSFEWLEFLMHQKKKIMGNRA